MKKIILEQRREVNMSIFNYCEDGNSRSVNCNSFKLDFESLSKK